ncbi:SusC/RagA family TonB-linked outer membrane protein [Labilibaculum euxinus]|uniref:SusC/RagA family TonB-linked outer membrane protein n=1 Tax=Labilibaculum euxinus TaxID=2686357 RepID=A0A7M4D1V4_9BACT|nr:TonB-dependent receptor [Labilibaculum euxinus]MUP36633.1 SusC/RagA family TonB-linked outer membrane protein [Labilibaculum euxinus]MVB05838.1 SusC/RagA family TonB-linked outer membrane protein [Labilibaculum euxinus]
MKKSLFSMLILFVIGLQGVLAQSREVSGVVTSADDGLSIPGVSVIVKGTTIGTTTDFDGNYSLNVPDDGKVLIFSFVGMTMQEREITSSTINVVMASESIGMDEIIVTGYGVTKKAAFTGAASTVGIEKIADRTGTNPMKALEGNVAGLQLNSASGQPGAPSKIYIRGKNSLNSGTQPLYVIDGIPMESGTWGMRESEGSEYSPLSSLNSNDIETITVLKDATATSIYGARAANGVIVVTTKKGSTGAKTKISFSAKLGWEELPSYTDKYKHINADQFNKLNVEGWKNYFGVSEQEAADMYYDGSIYGAYSLSDQGLSKDNLADVDWVDEITRKGKVQEYNFSLQSAGKDEYSPKIYMSLGYLDNEALIKGKDFKRYSFRLNLEQKPVDWITYGVNTSLSYTETNMGAGGGYFSDPLTQAYMQSPLTPVKDENGNWNFNTVNGYNPVAQRSEDGDKSENKNYRAIISPYVTVRLMPELSYTSRAGIDFMHMNEFGYWSFLQPQGNDMRGMGENGTNDQTLITITNTLNYIKTFNENHNVNLLAGQETSSTNLNTTYLSGSNYPVPDKNVVSLAATPGSAKTDKYELRLASFFFNGQYDYKSKYYLSASYRYDGSSRFGKDQQWASFWSVGAKYRITAEDFMATTSEWLSNLTLRTSYGTSGNQSVGITDGAIYSGWYASRPLYGYGYNYNSDGGSSAEQYGNSNLKWEETAKFNVGVDATFLGGIFDFTFDYYYHKTQDMVFRVPMSFTSGFKDIPQNIGELENKGVEFSLRANIIKNADLTWNVTAVASKNNNKVTKLSTDFPIESTYTIIEKGKDIYQFKMKEFAGVDAQTGDALYYLNEMGDETTTNYNAAAKRYVGTASPDWQGSFSTNLTYKNFDFSLQANYSIGGKIYGSSLRYDEQRGGSINNITTRYVYENRWQNPGDITDVPRFEMGISNKHSSQFLMDGDYLKIQNVVLGYTLPSVLTNKMHMSKVRFYTSVSNLYTFTKSNYRGFDPAGVGAKGVQWWNYPTPRTYMFGVNVNF